MNDETASTGAAALPRPAMVVLTVLIPFGCGYYLSYLFRTVNAVISPQLVGEFGLTPADLGLLTGVYFVTFASVQIPLGVVLDRYGPRRVQAALLVAAAAGAAVFATAETYGALIVGRGLIGLGVSACLMASFKANALWWPKERLTLMNSITMAFGSFGALSATAPVEALLQVTGWREIFWGLAVVTAAVAAITLVVVPERAASGAAAPAGLRRQFAELPAIYGSAAFWRYAAPMVVCYAVFMSYQTLWAAPWLRDVAGLGRGGVAEGLLWIQVGMFVGVLGSGIIADRLRRLAIGPEFLLGAVFALAIAIQAALAAGVTAGAGLLWAVWAMFAASTILSISILTERFPQAMTGRVTTGANLMIFVLAFPAQWGIGWVIGLFAPTATGYSTEAHATALTIAVGLQVAAFVFFVWPRRRPSP